MHSYGKCSLTLNTEWQRKFKLSLKNILSGPSKVTNYYYPNFSMPSHIEYKKIIFVDDENKKETIFWLLLPYF